MSHASGPTRIAFCITELDPGGAERAFVRLVTGLDRRRWDPVVFCLAESGPLVEDLEQSGIPVTCLGARGLRHSGVVFTLARELRRAQPQLLQTFLFHANLLGRLAGWRAGIKHIVSGIRVAEKRTRTHLWLDRITNGLVERNVCVSHAVAEFSIREARLDPRKTLVIPNGVDASRFASAAPADLKPLGIAPGDPVFIAVGRLDPQKGLAFLLDAMHAILATHPDAHLLLVGEGPERAALQSLIAIENHTDRIHLLGWRPDVPELLRAANCLVLSSLWEGMPNVVLEGMAAGLPVVATRVEGIAELITEGEQGLLVSAGSAVELTDAMAQILASPEQAQQMGRQGRQKVETAFSWGEMVNRYDRLYCELLGAGTENA